MKDYLNEQQIKALLDAAVQGGLHSLVLRVEEMLAAQRQQISEEVGDPKFIAKVIHDWYPDADMMAARIAAAVKGPLLPGSVDEWSDDPSSCWICGDNLDHGGYPHALAMGDGLTRNDVLQLLDYVWYRRAEALPRARALVSSFLVVKGGKS